MRTRDAAAVSLVIASTLAFGARAQVYPSRPVTIIVPFAAGGPSDTLTRIVAERMRVTLGQPIIIDNIGGAAGRIGTARLARAAPDGYTIGHGSAGTHMANGAVYTLNYDVLTDFAPVALLAAAPQIIVAKKSMPANNLVELIAWLKANPDRASQATSGLGGYSHLAGLFFQNETGARFQFVAYRGGVQSMQDLLAGQIDLMIDQASNALLQVRSGNIKAYAIAAAHRLAEAPDIPTVDEAGLPGFHFSHWYALFAPKDTPLSIVQKLNAAAFEALEDPTVRDRLTNLGLEIFHGTNERPARFPASTRPRPKDGGQPSEQLESRPNEQASYQHFRGRTVKLSRRQLLHVATLGAVLPAASRVVRAQNYPIRPVRVLVSSPPGGTADFLARVMGQWLSERLVQPFVIENKGGSGNIIAAEAVASASPDGHTLLVINPAHALNATLYDKLNFNLLRDIAPVAGLVRAPNVMEVHPLVPANTVPEFIAYAKANPGKVNYASAGTGTLLHVAGELFKMMAGIDMVHVPYRGTAPALTDLLGGQVQMMCDNISTSIEHIRAGKLRALAVTTAKRSELLPDLPTVGDFLPGFEQSAFFGIGAPRNTPLGVIETLNAEINAGLTDPKIKARLAEIAGPVLTGSPADFGNLVAQETEKWGKVIRRVGIRPE